MLEWDNFEKKFRADSRNAFDELAYFLFCKQLNLSEGITRRINQAHIEADPVEIDNELIGYQAKYFDAQTKLRDKTAELKDSIKGAAKKYKGISRIFFYINKELTDSSNDDTYIPDYQKRIEEYAGTYDIEINWYTLSKLEYLLRKPEYRYIHDYFFKMNSVVTENLLDYYSYVERLYNAPDKEAQLVGEGSLSETFIEAYYVDEKVHTKRNSVIKELETWCTSSASRVCIIHGQPGHGKTSLCKHAVSGFFNDYLFQKYNYQAIGTQLAGNAGKKLIHLGTTVENVLWFSINPLVVKDIIDFQSRSIELARSFCWGVEGENKFFASNVSALRNSLIFLDGYDELIYKAAQVTKTRHLRDFITKVNSYAEEYNIHFVITARSASIKNELNQLPDDIAVKIMRLDRISKDQQVDWMRQHGIDENYINYIRYINDHDLQKLLGIPILFKMIVNYKLRDLNNDNTIGLYDKLFAKTMERHCIPIDDAKIYHEELEIIAYKMFCLNEEVIPYSEEKLRSSVGYTYYIEVESILGFYHRSFYQYFICHYLYRQLVNIKNESDAMNFLKKICYSAIDIEILYKLLEIGSKPKIRKEQVDFLFRLIDKTDSIFVIDEDDFNTSRFDRCNYAFYNTLSIAHVLGIPVRVNEHGRICELLRWYDIRKLMLDNSDLSNSSYSRVNWDGVSAKYSNMNYVNFTFAFLKNVVFSNSHLKNTLFTNAILKNAELVEVDLSEANLYRADFCGANLTKAILYKNICNNTIFKYTNLSKTRFSDIEFINVDFSHARLADTVFTKCIVPQCNFYGASLSGVKFSGSTISSISLDRAHMLGASFNKSVLNEVSFIGAYAIGSVFHDSELKGGSFKSADLRGADFKNTYIKDIDFSGSDIREAIFENTVLINCIFTSEDESDYYSETKTDRNTIWKDTKIYIDYRSEQYNDTRKFFSELPVELIDLNGSNLFLEWI